MLKPFLLTVDDDPSVLRAVERDLRNKYAADYRILRAESGKAALELLAQLMERKEDVALILADQRMPEMDGMQFLAKARELFPDARRVLLTAYADTNAAIAAIKVVGQRWNPEAHRIKDFLGRHHVPFRWVDVAEAANDDTLRDFLTTKRKLPFIVFPDGSLEECPDSEALATKLEIHTKADTKAYDLVIIDGGPAGLAAAVYGASEGLRTLMIDRDAPGGQAALSSRIENYLGFPSGLSGGHPARRAVAQARKFGVEILAPQECVQLRTEEPDQLTLADGAEVAGQAAMHFSHFARKVTRLVRGDGLSATMSKYLIDQIEATPNIEVRAHSEVVAVEGAEHLESIPIRNRQLGSEETVAAQLLFIFIGARPCTGWLKATRCLDEHGFVRTGPALSKNGQLPQRWPLPRDPMLLETSIPGVFAAGDTRSGSVKRVASSVGEGSVVVQFVHHFLSGH